MLYARFTHPEWGFPGQGERAISDGLVVGERYAVCRVDMGQSFTTIHISDFGCYNSVLFDFEDEDELEHDIYRDPKYNSYMDLRLLSDDIFL